MDIFETTNKLISIEKLNQKYQNEIYENPTDIKSEIDKILAREKEILK
jgi:hypothetical protein